MKKPPNPCYKCPDRHAGCHAECDRYGKWSKITREMNAERHEQREKRLKTYPISMDSYKSARNKEV